MASMLISRRLSTKFIKPSILSSCISSQLPRNNGFNGDFAQLDHSTMASMVISRRLSAKFFRPFYSSDPLPSFVNGFSILEPSNFNHNLPNLNYALISKNKVFHTSKEEKISFFPKISETPFSNVQLKNQIPRKFSTLPSQNQDLEPEKVETDISALANDVRAEIRKIIKNCYIVLNLAASCGFILLGCLNLIVYNIKGIYVAPIINKIGFGLILFSVLLWSARLLVDRKLMMELTRKFEEFGNVESLSGTLKNLRNFSFQLVRDRRVVLGIMGGLGVVFLSSGVFAYFGYA